MSGSNGWIGVDLDGTLAMYDGWKGPEHIGEPVPDMLERVKRWIAAGHHVRIFTARVSERDPEQLALVRAAIDAWCEKHFGGTLPVTCEKDYGMVELWDDRAVQVIANTGEPVGFSTRGLDEAEAWRSVTLAQLTAESEAIGYPVCVGGPFDGAAPMVAMMWRDTVWIPSGRSNAVYRAGGGRSTYLGMRSFE